MGFISFLMFAFLVLCIVGYFRGWYRLARRRDPQTGKLKFEISFDSEKAQEDAVAARRRAGEVLAPQAAQEQMVQGTIVEIKAEPDSLTVRSADERNIPVQLSAATTVRFHDGAGSLKDLHIGDRASIRYWPEYGRNVAQVVIVERDR